MKITRLYLKNFIAINTAQGKREIEIIFPEDKVIHLLYGKMGSGKTFILGHCQPWHTIGTLDKRNGDQQIVDGENGEKVIEYLDGNNYYIITHNYIWNKTSHLSKHYIKKNGVELNSNGNLTTFDEIIKLEFGIDQDYLKIIRIGNNVINLISMKATERKKFMAEINASSQSWLFYFKQLSQELKNLNAQGSLLMKSLSDLNYHKIDEMIKEHDELEEIVNELTYKEMEYRERIMQLNGSLTAILNGEDRSSYKNGTILLKIEEMKRSVVEYDKSILSYQNDLSSLEGLTETEISKELGECSASLAIYEEKRESLSYRYNDIRKEVESIRNKLSIKGNETHKKNLRNTYQSLEIQVLNLEKEVSLYRYDYSYQYLIELLNTIESINRDLIYLSNFPLDDIIPILSYGIHQVKEAQKRSEILRAKLQSLQNEANNIQYSGTYKPPFKLFRAPFCPSKECPFYTTHPSTIAKKSKKSEALEILENRRGKIQQINSKIARYDTYPTIYSYLEKIEKEMNSIMEPLSSMNLLKEHRIELIVGKQKNWVDGDTLVRYLELAQKRSELFILRERLLTAKDQLNQLEMEESTNLEEKLISLSKEEEKLSIEIEETSKKIQEKKLTMDTINEKYMKFMRAKQIIEDLAYSLKEKEILLEQISLFEDRIEKYQLITNKMNALDDERMELASILEEKKKRLLSDTIQIEKIKDLKIKYDDILKEIHYYTLITEGVSPKTGIPVHLVGMFMNDCLDTINELISGIFDDNLEIEKFEPTEDSFYIPYNKNGFIIDDISKASQGETSIIGQSISFAIMENSMSSIRYNIPLLDEPDAALHAEDRNRFLMMLLRHMKAINGEQCIVISHNQTFEGYPIHLILTSDEEYVSNNTQIVTRV